MIKTAYLIFSKIPELGQVKTRLATDLSVEKATAIQAKMLQHLFWISTQLGPTFTSFFFYQGQDPQKIAAFLKSVPANLQCYPQTTGSLGQKMAQAMQQIQTQGYDQVILTGSDIPQVTSALLQQAQALLVKNDLILGPTFDGGYYLIGTKTQDVTPFLTADISWSTNSVLQTTKDLIQQQHLTLGLLPTMVDVDFEADLKQVKTLVDF